MNAYIQSSLKAFAAGIAAAAAYLVGVLGGDATFDSVTLTEWLGLIPVVAGVYGITWTVPNTPAIVHPTAGDVVDIVEAFEEDATVEFIEAVGAEDELGG